MLEVELFVNCYMGVTKLSDSFSKELYQFSLTVGPHHTKYGTLSITEKELLFRIKNFLIKDSERLDWVFLGFKKTENDRVTWVAPWRTGWTHYGKEHFKNFLKELVKELDT